jgi:glycopeptide antibiotics resistance protein
MNSRDWYSNQRLWPIIRRWIVAITAGCLVWGVLFGITINPRWNWMWFPILAVPTFLTLVHLNSYFAEKRKRAAREKK